VLGAGGTARAALGAARDLGAAAVTIYARRVEAIAELDEVAGELGLTLIAAPWDAAAECGAADVIVATTPAGVCDALADAVRWRPESVVFDAVYHPWPTPIAEAASAVGCRIVSGLDLLLTQAVRQFELYTGVDAPVAAMRTALFDAAAARR
jgi:shikimate dehydrogenase